MAHNPERFTVQPMPARTLPPGHSIRSEAYDCRLPLQCPRDPLVSHALDAIGDASHGDPRGASRPLRGEGGEGGQGRAYLPPPALVMKYP